MITKILNRYIQEFLGLIDYTFVIIIIILYVNK